MNTNIQKKLTSELEKPYKAEQDAAREQMLAEIAAVLHNPEPPKGAFTVFDAMEALKDIEPGLQSEQMRQRLNRDERVEKIGIFGRRMYYRIKDD